MIIISTNSKRSELSLTELKDIINKGTPTHFIQYSQLSELLNYDSLSIESIESLVEGMKKEMKRKEILKNHRPAIKQLANGRFYTRIDGKKVVRKNLKDIEDVVIDFYKDNTYTLENIFDDFLTRRKLEVSPTTWSKDIRFFNTYIKNSSISNKPISELKLSDGYNFLNDCLTINPNMKRKYWNNISGCLNQMIQYAIDQDIINNNPFKNMRPKKDLFTAPTYTRDGDTVFTKREQVLVCRFAEDDSSNTNNAIPLGIILLFNLGIRDGELCAMKWSDIESNFRRTYIHIQRELITHIDDNGKTNGFEVVAHCKTQAGDRRLQLNDKAIDTFKRIKELNELNGLRTELDDYIFLRWVDGEATFCTPRSFDPRLRRYCKKANMDVIKSPHDVRRTVLTNLYNAGMPLKKIQEFAGHSSLKQTIDYIRISDEDLDLSDYLNTLSDTSESTTDNIIRMKKEA